MAELFDVGKSTPLVHAMASTRRQYTQQERCKRCRGSTNDSEGAYCFRLDLCLEFDSGDVLLTKNGQAITCDGKEWHYRGVSEISVRHRDGWCATRRKNDLRYSDSVPTLCGYVVMLPWGIERREPDCPECVRILQQRKASR